MAKTLRPCQCSTFTAYDLSGDVEYTTACTAETARTFAPGHDARLKGHLIRWAKAGYEIRVGSVTRSAEQWAAGFGFGRMVAEGIAREAKPRKAKNVDIRKVTAKVGRWTYDGTLHGGHTFHYEDKQGVHHGTQNFKLVG